MTLKETISADFIKALKEKDTLKKSLLSTIKGEIQTVEKNSNSGSMSDEDVIKILNKFSKSLKENISLGDENSKLELDIISSYLPKEMGEDEIRNIVDKMILSGVRNMGLIMKEFNGLQVDKKLVSTIVKTHLENNEI